MIDRSTTTGWVRVLGACVHFEPGGTYSFQPHAVGSMPHAHKIPDVLKPGPTGTVVLALVRVHTDDGGEAPSAFGPE